MTDIETLKSNYFVDSDDAELPSRPVPSTVEDCTVEYFFGATEYYNDLSAEIKALGDGDDEFCYVSGWFMDFLGNISGEPDEVDGGSGGAVAEVANEPLALESGDEAQPIISLLASTANEGIDVRVLPFASWALLAFDFITSREDGGEGFIAYSEANIRSVDALRDHSALAQKCCVNTISHTAGSAHAKLIVLGDSTEAVAYTGGLDLADNRRSDPNDPDDVYHDAQAKLAGPAVQDAYDFFKQMYNEVLSNDQLTFSIDDNDIENYVSGTPAVPDRTLSKPSTDGSIHLQTLRTAPQKNYAVFAPGFGDSLETEPLSFAEEGLFEVEVAWKKAIGNASTYIYMEDQAFVSPEILSAIGDQLQAESDLVVILLTDGSDFDSRIGGTPTAAAMWEAFEDLEDDEKDRLGIFLKDIRKVHSKTTIIDDEWAIIGSANCMQRSLYTDLEHAVGILDADGGYVPEYRSDLWATALDEQNPALLWPLEGALNVWNDEWGSGGTGVDRPSRVHAFSGHDLAPTESLSELGSEWHRIHDVDSREPWRPIF